MNRPWRIALLLSVLLSPAAAWSQELRTEHVLLVTLDGLRWQEVFGGADSLLLRDPRFVGRPDESIQGLWTEDPAERRRALLPFFWTVIADRGQIYGNRTLGNEVNATNGLWFSYPGYNELLVGYPDAGIASNDKRPNPNRTVLEFVHAHPSFRGRVAAFASWDVFPFIINEPRSGIPVNAGFEAAEGKDLTEREVLLNELQRQIPSPSASARPDAFTHHYAMEYLKKRRPRLLYVAYGETDEFAHQGKYDAYLRSAHRIDAMLRDLWEWVQSEPEYRGKTTLVITTDHGRGSGDLWTKHGKDVPGADEIWMAVIGPDTPPSGEMKAGGRLSQSQVARTVAAFLGLDYSNERPVGPVVQQAISR